MGRWIQRETAGHERGMPCVSRRPVRFMEFVTELSSQGTYRLGCAPLSPSLLLLWYTVAGQIFQPLRHGRRWRRWTDGLWLTPSPARLRRRTCGLEVVPNLVKDDGRRFVQVKLSRLVHRDAVSIHLRRLLDVYQPCCRSWPCCWCCWPTIVCPAAFQRHCCPAKQKQSDNISVLLSSNSKDGARFQREGKPPQAAVGWSRRRKYQVPESRCARCRSNANSCWIRKVSTAFRWLKGSSWACRRRMRRNQLLIRIAADYEQVVLTASKSRSSELQRERRSALLPRSYRLEGKPAGPDERFSPLSSAFVFMLKLLLDGRNTWTPGRCSFTTNHHILQRRHRLASMDHKGFVSIPRFRTPSIWRSSH